MTEPTDNPQLSDLFPEDPTLPDPSPPSPPPLTPARVKLPRPAPPSPQALEDLPEPEPRDDALPSLPGTGLVELERQLMVARGELIEAPPEPEPEEDPSELFNIEAFERFCGKLKIDSKELGQVPLTWLGTQRYVVEKIAEGLAQDKHTFVILKGRQLGISTVTLALDIYWLFKHSGLQGAVVTDTDENREVFRSYIEQYIKTLPPKARGSVRRHNRIQLILKNRSRMVYMVAGTRKKGDLGRAKSANFMHGTECSSWGDEEGFGSLVNTLAQKNPKRLYVLESTARGYNMFYQTWEVAKASKTQVAIFVGWWLNELYSWGDETVEFKEYWNGELTADEKVWVAEVFERYGFNITPNQIAWWRWYVAEQMKGDEQLALQEMPPTEEYAFQLSGSKFFSAERVNAAYQRARILNDDPDKRLFFRYRFGLNFEDTEFLPCDEDEAEVTVWELPVVHTDPLRPPAKYIVGADPAYGSSEWADEFAACGFRAYADKIRQVFELGTPNWTDQQYAWALAHLCGWYGDTMLNLEMQGPGTAVFNELQNLKKAAAFLPAGDPRAGAFDVVSRIRDYMWKKQDSMVGGFAWQWQTNAREKVRMMSTFRSYFERDGMIELNSPACIQQLRNIHRQGDSIGGEGRAKDDRVIAAAIATIAWNDWVMVEMQAAGRTYQVEHRPDEIRQAYSPLERSLVNYLRRNEVQLRGLT